MWKTTIDLAALKAAARADLARVRSDYAFAIGAVAALAALGALTQTIGAACARMPYPFTLEWMEGGIVDHVRIVLAGKPLYREPSLEWTPFIYPPLYYWVCAVFMKVFGVSVFWARFVSVISMVGCFALIAAFVRKEVGRGWIAPLVAAGFFAVTFKITGLWMDLARVDSLFFVLFLGGAYLTRFGRTPIHAGVSGLLLFLSFFTKQTGLVLAAPVLLAGLGLDRRRGLVAGAVFGGLTIGAIQWMDLSSDGWFRYYIFKVASLHSSAWEEWHPYVLKTLWEPMPLALGLALVAFGAGVFERRMVMALYAGILVVAWVHAFTGMLHNGGYLNALIPYCGFLSILGGVTVGWVMKQAPATDGGGGIVRRFQAIAAGAALLQLLALAYDQRPFVPRRRDVFTGKAVIERWRKLRQERGQTFSFGFGYYEMLAGSEEIHAHTMALSDIFKTGDPQRTDPLRDEILRTLKQHRYRTVVYDASLDLVPPEIQNTLRLSYRAQGHLFEPGEEDRTWPKTAFGCRPNELWMAP